MPILAFTTLTGAPLGIAYYGLSVTTMEEVFLKVAMEKESSAVERRKTQDAIRRLSTAHLESMNCCICALLCVK